ncbi:hypothetical protein ACJMK2_035490 [Sinanodonta woodiana]|uniref:Uncharacterized protein n=1 Tax=Sinanodonta woodiana TaxID=1069815 RepID=A0ABD3WWI6_SINWO
MLAPLASGQVKLAVSIESGFLTVNVLEARHIRSALSTLPDSFVQISLIMDETKTCRCSTEIISNSSNPVYDEKFSFELTDEDLHKRVMISIWHQDSVTRSNEFLGCTSFGIARLRKTLTGVKGWHYLLNETVGRKKHLQINKRERLLASINRRASLPPVIPAINMDITGGEQLNLTVHKGKGGFGFTLVESCPVKVGRVDGDSHAAETGLKKDDVIIRVNDINVSRSTLTSVNKLVKNSGSKVNFDVIRQKSDVFVETMEESRHVPRTNADLTKLRDSGYVSPPFIKIFARLKSLFRLSFNLS